MMLDSNNYNKVLISGNIINMTDWTLFCRPIRKWDVAETEEECHCCGGEGAFIARGEPSLWAGSHHYDNRTFN